MKALRYYCETRPGGWVEGIARERDLLGVLTDRTAGLLRWMVVAVFAASAGFFVVTSIHWPLMCDSPVMHYVTFLMDHGMRPYQDITDNNMPGSYLTESWAMHVFGGSDLGWRIYDFFLLGVLTVTMMAITRRRDWVAGVYAGGLFLVQYGAQGPNYSVEREQIVTVLLMIGYALLFLAVRRQRAWLLLGFGFVDGMAASIKPTFVLVGLLLLVVTGYVLRRRKVGMLPYLGWGLLGFALALGVNLAFLARYHAIGAFWFVLHVITPSYVGLAKWGMGQLLNEALPHGFVALVVVIGLPLAVLNRDWDWERWALLLGAGVGVLSYLIQRKGFIHHKYTMETIVFLLLGMELMAGLRRAGWPRLLATAGVLVTLLVFVPHYLVKMRAIPGRSALTEAMERDLTHLGGDQLQGQVQCFDLIFGCLNSLYHLKLIENTGFTGDLLFFFPQGGAGTRYYRGMFRELAKRDPANVLVMTNEWFQKPNSYDKVKTWPEFASYLEREYTLVKQRSFPLEHLSFRTPEGGEVAGYRIYVRNGSALAGVARERLAVP